MAHVEDLGFTLRELNLAILTGDVRKQVHPDFPELAIYNYTEDVQYRSRWNNITLACRGLILNQDTGEVVARPWEKFFNLGQMDNRIESDAPVEVTDKMDGSLGILYRLPGTGKFNIATRGSFASEQAIHATNLLNTKYADYDVDRVAGYWLGCTTYLFEIIYPTNRIVVNYGDQDDLVLLGGVDMQRGYYYGPTEAGAQIAWPGPVTEVWQYEKFTDAISAPDRPGKEGYCIRSGNKIVKLKQADYVELHRIVTNLSPKTVWEMLGAGKTVNDICGQIPDEFHKYVTDIAEELNFEASKITFETNICYSKIVSDLTTLYGKDFGRRQFANMATVTPYAKYLFLLLDGKSIKDTVWQAVRPKGDLKLIKES